MFVGETEVLAACERLTDLHAWPASKIDARGWLQNFDAADRIYASHMLHHFMFFCDEIVDALFISAFQSISNRLRPGWCSRSEANVLWNGFLDEAFITMVQGEIPNPSDSGFQFVRKARQVLGMSEHRLLSPDSALKAAADGSVGPIIFVDDFVGSGEQFLSTWERRRTVPGHGEMAFKDLPPKKGRLFVYCSVMVTEHGRDRIAAKYPSVLLVSGNVIPATYNWTSQSSLLWPEEERDNGIAFIRRMSEQIGFHENGGGEKDWQGFHKLGLGVAFEHSTPDATLPLFHWAQNWRPLVRRS